MAQHLAAQVKPMEEKEILSMYQQMVAAIKYMHGHNILHRYISYNPDSVYTYRYDTFLTDF